MIYDYIAEGRRVSDLQNTALQKHVEWLKYLLTVCIALFGALISLHPTPPDTLLLRWCFAISSVLLAFGILLISMALYSAYEQYNTLARKARKELLLAIQKGDIPSAAGAHIAKGFVICRRLGYVFLLSSTFSFAVYLVISSFS